MCCPPGQAVFGYPEAFHPDGHHSAIHFCGAGAQTHLRSLCISRSETLYLSNSAVRRGGCATGSLSPCRGEAGGQRGTIASIQRNQCPSGVCHCTSRASVCIEPEAEAGSLRSKSTLVLGCIWFSRTCEGLKRPKPSAFRGLSRSFQRFVMLCFQRSVGFTKFYGIWTINS